MPYIKVKIWSGDVFECIQTLHSNYGNHKNRDKKVSKSTERQILLNEKNAKRKLCRLINANFVKGDIFVTLTYRGQEPTFEQAQRDLVNYLRRIVYRRKKLGLPRIKYIGTTEYEEQRANQHIIMSAMSLDTLTELWGKGGVTSRKLYSEEYTGLANYISKERKRHSRKWTASRNLKKPVILSTVVKDGSAKVKLPKDYKTLEYSYNSTEEGFYHQYLKALKIGGVDYADKWQGPRALDTGAVQKVSGGNGWNEKISQRKNRSGRTQVRKPKGS